MLQIKNINSALQVWYTSHINFQYLDFRYKVNRKKSMFKLSDLISQDVGNCLSVFF